MGYQEQTYEQFLNEIFENRPDTQVLFVGSVNCLRHRPYMEIGRLMQERRASVLLPSMSDFSTGRYLCQIKDAVKELAAERKSKAFAIMYGCQWVILSTDGEMLRQELWDEQGIEVRLMDTSHLEPENGEQRG